MTREQQIEKKALELYPVEYSPPMFGNLRDRTDMNQRRRLDFIRGATFADGAAGEHPHTVALREISEWEVEKPKSDYDEGFNDAVASVKADAIKALSAPAVSPQGEFTEADFLKKLFEEKEKFIIQYIKDDERPVSLEWCFSHQDLIDAIKMRDERDTPMLPDKPKYGIDVILSALRTPSTKE